MGMGPLLLECHGAIDNLTMSPRDYVTLVTEIDPYVIAELSYWRSHWLRWPDRPIPAFLLDNRSDVTGLWPASINKHVTQHLEAVEFRTS